MCKPRARHSSSRRDLQISPETRCKKHRFLGTKLNGAPKSGFSMARFFDLLKITLEMAGTGNEGGAHQLRCAILAVQLCPNTLGGRGARPLAELSPPRATASP